MSSGEVRPHQGGFNLQTAGGNSGGCIGIVGSKRAAPPETPVNRLPVPIPPVCALVSQHPREILLEANALVREDASNCNPQNLTEQISIGNKALARAMREDRRHSGDQG